MDSEEPTPQSLAGQQQELAEDQVVSGEEPDQHEEEPAAEVESHAEDALSV